MLSFVQQFVAHQEGTGTDSYFFFFAVLVRGNRVRCGLALLVAPGEPVVPKKFDWVWRSLIGTGHCVSGTKLIAAPADALRMVRVNGKLLGH
jgi:hypothetical protein